LTKCRNNTNEKKTFFGWLNNNENEIKKESFSLASADEEEENFTTAAKGNEQKHRER
jgi:hypothetical protein